MRIFAAPFASVSSLHVLTKYVSTKNVLFYVLCIAVSIWC